MRNMRPAIIYDYIDDETLYIIMNQIKEFGSFSNYEVMDNMIVKTIKMSQFSLSEFPSTTERFWKFVNTPDGWEAYEISQDGVQLDEPFSLYLGN